MIKKSDYYTVIKFYDNCALEYYPEVDGNEELLDMFADSNMSYVCLRGEHIPIAFDKDKGLIMVFDQCDTKVDPTEAVEILKNCEWDDTPLRDRDNYIAVINGMYNFYEVYNF